MKNNATPSVGAMLQGDRAEFLEQTLQTIGDIPALILSSGNNSDMAIDEILVKVGNLFSASRVYVMLDEKDGKYLRNTHEWVNTKTGPVMFSWPLYDYEYDIPSLKKIILEHKVFFGNSRDMPQDLGHVLSKQGVRSVIISPIIHDNANIGLLGVDFCDEECEFCSDYSLVLHHIAGMIAMALERKKYTAIRSKIAAIRDVLSDISPIPEMQNQEETITTAVRPPKPVTLLDAERRIIIETLELYNGNKLKTAKHLGLTWPSLDRRCKKLGIEARRK